MAQPGQSDGEMRGARGQVILVPGQGPPVMGQRVSPPQPSSVLLSAASGQERRLKPCFRTKGDGYGAGGTRRVGLTPELPSEEDVGAANHSWVLSC